ncbi:hypothetical protein AWENTII_006849 [Aspergillus wentii]
MLILIRSGQTRIDINFLGGKGTGKTTLLEHLAAKKGGVKSQSNGITSYTFAGVGKYDVTLNEIPDISAFFKALHDDGLGHDGAILCLSAAPGEEADPYSTQEFISVLKDQREYSTARLMVAVNKMDAAEWSEKRFEKLAKEWHELYQQKLGYDSHRTPIFAISSTEGDHIADDVLHNGSKHMPWHIFWKVERGEGSQYTLWQGIENTGVGYGRPFPE